MFPPEIISKTTLSDKIDNFVITFQCKLNNDGSIKTYDIYPSVISPVIRLNYYDLQETIKYLELDNLKKDYVKSGEISLLFGLKNNIITRKKCKQPQNKSIQYLDIIKKLLYYSYKREMYFYIFLDIEQVKVLY